MNRRPSACKADALPTELYPHLGNGLEPFATQPYDVPQFAASCTLEIQDILCSRNKARTSFPLVGKVGFEPTRGAQPPRALLAPRLTVSPLSRIARLSEPSSVFPLCHTRRSYILNNSLPPSQVVLPTVTYTPDKPLLLDFAKSWCLCFGV